MVFSPTGARTAGEPHRKKNQLGVWLTLYTKINSKWVLDLNIRTETMKLLEEIIGENLYDFRLDKFMCLTVKTGPIKEKQLISWTFF